MTRKLSRLRDFGTMGLNSKVLTWSQRVCEQIEAQFASVFDALSTMPDMPDVHVAADYTGTVQAGQLPLDVTAQRFSGTTDNTADAVWSFATDNGALTATITAGVLTITAITATANVTVTSSYAGVDKSRLFTAYLDVAAPPATGTTSGTTATDTTFSSFNSATMSAVSDELTVTVGSGGNVDLAAPLTVSTANALPNGTFQTHGIWRKWNGAAYVDLGTEVASNPDCSRFDGNLHSGALTVSHSDTGLTPGATEKYQLYARNNAGTRTMYLTGTASAVGS